MVRPTFQIVLTIVLLLAFAGGVLLERIRFYNTPLHGDICAYALIGHEMMGGRKLYSDLWERKPPLLYATFAVGELLVGYGRQEIFLVNVVAAVGVLFALYAVGCGCMRDRRGGLFAAGLWMLLGCDLELAGNQPEPELFINFFICASFALLVHWPQKRSLKRALLVGCLMAAATMYKHNVLIVCAALCAAHLLGRLDRRGFYECVTIGGVIGVVWGGMFAWFAAKGRLHDLIDVLFHQNLSYSGNLANNFGRSLHPGRLFPSFMIWAIGPAVLLGLAALRGVRPSSQWMLWIFWVIGVWATVALTGYVYPHYYQLWVPVWCVAGAWAGVSLIRPGNTLPAVIRYPTLVVVLIVLCFRQIGQFQLTPEQWVARQFPYFNLVEQNQLGVDLGVLLKPNEKFWELGEDNALYFFSRHDPPSGLLYIDPLIYGDETDVYWQRLLSDLNRNPPDLIVISSAWLQFIPRDAPVFGLIWRSYVPAQNVVVPPMYQFLVRRGSSLEHRLASPGS